MTKGARGALIGLGVPVLLLLAIQLVPYGRDHANPPAKNPVAWDSPRTGELARRACFDCHSNETRWPWYASIAPLSWRIQTDVNLGRRKLNFSAFEAGTHMAEAAGDAAESVVRGAMPPEAYLSMHPEARLRGADRESLVAGLAATFAAFAKRGEEHRGSPGRTRP